MNPDPLSVAGEFEGSYFDDQGCIKEEYVCRASIERLARSLCEGKPPLTSSQLRRFFGHSRAIETKLRSKSTTWPCVRDLLHRLDAAAAESRAKSKISLQFHEFIRCNVEKIQTEKDFLRGFLPHFEAVVAFSQAHLAR